MPRTYPVSGEPIAKTGDYLTMVFCNPNFYLNDPFGSLIPVAPAKTVRERQLVGESSKYWKVAALCTETRQAILLHYSHAISLTELGVRAYVVAMFGAAKFGFIFYTSQATVRKGAS